MTEEATKLPHYFTDNESSEGFQEFGTIEVGTWVSTVRGPSSTAILIPSFVTELNLFQQPKPKLRIIRVGGSFLDLILSYHLFYL